MNPENIKTYAELPEEDQKKYKPINKKGDFVEKTAVKDPEVAHRLAISMNEAFGELQERVKQSNLSVEEIKEKLSDRNLDYDEKRSLQQLLFENADLQRLKGRPIDDQLKEILEKSYTSLRYSDILEKKIIDGIEPGDVGVIGEVLKDEMITSDRPILEKLKNDEQCLQAFKLCQKRIKAACSIIDKIEDINLALKMYAKALKLADKKSYSDNGQLESTGKDLASKLFKAKETKKLINLVKSNTFQLSYFKKFLHLFGNEPKTIINLVKNSQKADDIFYALKFVADPKLLNKLEVNSDTFPKLDKEQLEKIAEYAKNIAQALSADPEVISLSKLKMDEQDQWSGRNKTAKNKFVIGIRDGKYYIAWSNVDSHEYHRNIFENLPRLEARSGGYVGMDEKDGKTMVRMVRSSGDYGFYSKEVLEHFRSAIEKKLHELLGEKEFELEIKTSSDYE